MNYALFLIAITGAFAFGYGLGCKRYNQWETPPDLEYGITPKVTFKTAGQGTEHEYLIINFQGGSAVVRRSDLEPGWRK